jgi:hypothetical protein
VRLLPNVTVWVLLGGSGCAGVKVTVRKSGDIARVPLTGTVCAKPPAFVANATCTLLLVIVKGFIGSLNVRTIWVFNGIFSGIVKGPNAGLALTRLGRKLSIPVPDVKPEPNVANGFPAVSRMADESATSYPVAGVKSWFGATVATVLGPLGPVPSERPPLIGVPLEDTTRVVPLTVVALIGSLNCTVTNRFVATSVLPLGGMICVTVGGMRSASSPVEKVNEAGSRSGIPAVLVIPIVMATVVVVDGVQGVAGVNRTSVLDPRSVAWNESVPGTAAPLLTVKVAAPWTFAAVRTVDTSREWLKSASITALVPTALCVWAGDTAATVGCGPVKPVEPLRLIRSVNPLPEAIGTTT